MTKHTPEPWDVYHGKHDDSPAAFVANSEDMVVVARLPPFEVSQETMEANAALIAAAPKTAVERDRLREINAELLAALKKCPQYILWSVHEARSSGVSDDVISHAIRDHKAVDDAIAHAEESDQ